MKRVLAIALVLVFAVALAACAGADPVSPAPQPSGAPAPAPGQTPAPDAAQQPAEGTAAGGHLSVGMQVDITSLYPPELRSPADISVSHFIFENIVGFDANGAPEPWLAEAIEEDPAALTYTFHLRPGVYFHDGSYFNAEVAAWNLTNYWENGALSGGFFGNVAGIDAVGEYTVVVSMSTWDSTFLYALARHTGIMQSMEAHVRVGSDGMREHPVGTGPFQWVNRDHGVRINLERFDNYWQGAPLLDTVEIVIIADPLVQQMALETGEIQVLLTDDFNTVAARPAGFLVNTTSVPRTSHTICFHAIDDGDNPLSDARVRQALVYAMDRAIINNHLFGEHSTPATQWALPGNPFFSSAITGFPHNPDRGRALLAEAGFPDGFDTVLHFRNVPLDRNMAQIIAEQISQIGVNVELNAVEPAGWGAGYVGGWSRGMILHPMGMDNGAASQLAANFVQGLTAGLGVASFDHPDSVDRLIREGLALTGAESAAVFQEVQRLVFEEYAKIAAISMVPTAAVFAPNFHDHGLCVTAYSRSTMWKAWLDQ